MRLRHRERRSVIKALLDGHVVPAKKFQGVQPVNGRQGIYLVQPRHDSSVFNIGQPADVENEVGSPSARRQFIAGALDIAVGESESLAGLPQTKTWKHQFLRN